MTPGDGAVVRHEIGVLGDVGDEGVLEVQRTPSGPGVEACRRPRRQRRRRSQVDVARRHGFYLILDIQPGYANFLDEAKRYEEFLREPDVGLVLDAEWRTTPPNRPGGGHIGTVDAVEVNAVAEWLAQLVEEEDLPEKLLVLHQFRPQMITNRDAIVEPECVAVVVHIDGFGTRGQKQHTWDQVRVDPPWDNALKLFYDEDVDMYQPSAVLAGAFDPMPVLITYQ